MMWRRSILLCAAALVAIGCAIAVLPARWLIHSMPANWPLALIDASGSLWAGQGVLALGPRDMQRTLPDPVRWHWRWQWASRPAIIVTHPWLTGPLTLTPGLTTLEIGAQRLRLPAQALTMAGVPFNSLEPGGQVQVSWPTVLAGSGPQIGPLLQIQWTDASSARVRVRPLGSYTAAITGRADRSLDLQVTTQSGALRVQGAGSRAPGGRWQFNGTAQPAPNTDPSTQDALAPLLSMLGRRRGDITTLQY